MKSHRSERGHLGVRHTPLEAQDHAGWNVAQRGLIAQWGARLGMAVSFMFLVDWPIYMLSTSDLNAI